MWRYFWAKTFPGPAFRLFGRHHLLMIGLIVAVNGALLWRGAQIPVGWQRPLQIGMAAALLLDEAALHLWRWRTDQWTLQEMLPFHLCAVMIYLSAIMLLTDSYALYEFVYLLGVAGAAQAILTPDAGPYGYPHFRFFQVFVSHGLIVTAGVWMTAVVGYRPFPSSIGRVLVWGVGYMAFVGVVNAILGSNYLYIARKPDTPSLIDAMPPWPWYIPILLLLAALFIGLMYVPFWVG